VTGHRGLSAETVEGVQIALREALAARLESLIGISCLAEGADHLFASEVVRAGGRLYAIIPATGFRESLPAEARMLYDSLVQAADRVHRMPYRTPDPESYMAASKFMLRESDELFAVWDGLPARGYGGTADVVAYARNEGIKVRVIWPRDSRRC